MVTKTYKFTVNYPEWLYRLRWDNIKRYSKWIIQRPVCHCCGKKLNFKTPEVSHRFNHGSYLTVHWFTNNRKISFCKECLSQAVTENIIQPIYGEDFYSYDTAPVCQLNLCGNPSFKHFKITFMEQAVDFRMCVNSWNSTNICLSCVAETLRKGEEKSSHYGQYNKKSVLLNDFGLPVVDGKVRFPW